MKLTDLNQTSLMVAMKNGALKRFDCSSRQFRAPVKMWQSEWSGLYEHKEMIIGIDKTGTVSSWSRTAFDELEQKNQKQFDAGESNVSFDLNI